MDGKTLIKPEKQARFLGVDEFKLHNGYKYASLIIDMESGHILWLSHGKRKRTVYDFIDHVGEAWMDGVEAVACDMNSTSRKPLRNTVPIFSLSLTTSTSSRTSMKRSLVPSARTNSGGLLTRGTQGRCRPQENQVHSHIVQATPAP